MKFLLMCGFRVWMVVVLVVMIVCVLWVMVLGLMEILVEVVMCVFMGFLVVVLGCGVGRKFME